jgi:CDP-glucose 4,6-dehydratase
MESMGMTGSFWRGRQVFVTGHTGFKGGWLSLWLQDLGAHVHGYALAPPTTPNLFAVAKVESTLAAHTIADIRDAVALADAIRQARAEIVIHMAAQPLVRLSYKEPVETFEVNVMGTVHVLEAVRACPTVRAVLVVTSDKCYENREWLWGYRETEALGGADPYSSSKACTELVTAAYRSSYFASAGVAVATARAGNVIGGGDWAADRLLPDFFRAVDSGNELEVRYPESTRPWQHVLQPLSGYIQLSEALLTQGAPFAQGWNFGPLETDSRPVRWVLDYLSMRVPGSKWRHTGTEHAHEARSLRLDSSKANLTLGWLPRWPLETALDKTLDWHARWVEGADMRAVCLGQLREFGTARGT